MRAFPPGHADFPERREAMRGKGNALVQGRATNEPCSGFGWQRGALGPRQPGKGAVFRDPPVAAALEFEPAISLFVLISY
jgi:hypothetical protein